MIYGSQAGFAPEENLSVAAQAFDDGRYKGFQWIVGLKQRGGDITGWSWKRFLLTVDIRVRWDDFGQYLASMRSDYRKQIAASLKKGKDTKFIQHTGNEFTDEDYKLFMAVHKAAKDDSDPLLKEFFRLFPVKHHYIKMRCGDSVLGWALLVPDGKDLHLLYIGYDVSKNNKFDTYVNLLLGSVRYAIENKYSCLKMGQTAELTKMRLGGTPSERYLLVRHSNLFVNWIISKTDIFNFRKYYPVLHVFKTREK
ncbi:GNAT family N-acetyltransferase [candidate division TA06 bacterium]|nr:GNAT family N-acetyltransferase [candidate division TA06 bacterium]